MNVEFEILEIEILLYLLNGRRELGCHADSAKRKLMAARRAELERKEPLFSLTDLEEQAAEVAG